MAKYINCCKILNLTKFDFEYRMDLECIFINEFNTEKHRNTEEKDLSVSFGVLGGL